MWYRKFLWALIFVLCENTTDRWWSCKTAHSSSQKWRHYCFCSWAQYAQDKHKGLRHLRIDKFLRSEQCYQDLNRESVTLTQRPACKDAQYYFTNLRNNKYELNSLSPCFMLKYVNDRQYKARTFIFFLSFQYFSSTLEQTNIIVSMHRSMSSLGFLFFSTFLSSKEKTDFFQLSKSLFIPT